MLIFCSQYKLCEAPAYQSKSQSPIQQPSDTAGDNSIMFNKEYFAWLISNDIHYKINFEGSLAAPIVVKINKDPLEVNNN